MNNDIIINISNHPIINLIINLFLPVCSATNYTARVSNKNISNVLSPLSFKQAFLAII